MCGRARASPTVTAFSDGEQGVAKEDGSEDELPQGRSPKEALAKAQAKVEDLYKHETRIIVEEDIPIVETLNYRAGGVMVPADRKLLTYLRYAERYLRIRQAELIALSA